MGCVASKADKGERLRICEERKRLMKQLMRCRKDFADAQVAYLRSLINTGLTLRQFTESQSLEAEETASGVGFSPSPPPPLPPSPPPPPPFSPDCQSPAEKPLETKAEHEELVESDMEIDLVPPPPPGASWESWDLYDSDYQEHTNDEEIRKNGADTHIKFVEDDEKKFRKVTEVEQEGAFPEDQIELPFEQQINHNDDNSSTSSWMKVNEDAAIMVWRGKKSLADIIKNLDEYFLKASATVKDVTVFIDIDTSRTCLQQSLKVNTGNKSNSAKVFSALSWNRSSRSFRYSRQKRDHHGEVEPCKPGAHCVTLEKLYLEEQKLYKNIKDEEVAKMEYSRKSSLLQREQDGKDQMIIEKTRIAVENLESRLLSLQESIEQCCSNILVLLNEELQPQLIALASGMMQMWRTMHKCHRIQHHISQQLNHLGDESFVEPTTEYLVLAASQLRTEVSSWYENFRSLVKFQREYIRDLCEWTKLVQGIHDIDSPWSTNSLHQLMEKWLQTLDKLPETMVSEAINSLLSAISNILTQLQEEQNIRRRCEKLERRLQRELSAFSELEMKFAGSLPNDDTTEASNSKHPLTLRRAKVEAHKKSVVAENAKYASCVKATKAMVLRNLKCNLPKTFEALTHYSSSYAQSFENILYNAVE